MAGMPPASARKRMTLRACPGCGCTWAWAHPRSDAASREASNREEYLFMGLGLCLPRWVRSERELAAPKAGGRERPLARHRLRRERRVPEFVHVRGRVWGARTVEGSARVGPSHEFQALRIAA